MIGITGANGKLGKLVIKSLLGKVEADNIVAFVRNVENAIDLMALGVTVREADYSKPETLNFLGVSKLLLISGSEVGQRVTQHQSVINAAIASGVGLLAYTSILKADTSPLALADEHAETEALIKTSGIPAVILRNGWYSENYTEALNTALQTGLVVGAANEGKFATATRADYAEAAAVVLTTVGHAGKVYELCGDEGFTLAEYTADVSSLTDGTVNYQDMSGADLFQFMVTVARLPEDFAAVFADSDVHAAQGWLHDDRSMLSTLIGRPTTPMLTTISEALYDLG